MMIETIVSMARYLTARHDDDLVDRMNYLYTPNALLAFSVLISFKQFGGRPLECMFPNKFPGSWEQYAENFCWSEDTYYLPDDIHVATIPENERYSSDRKLSYYQWVPFFLLLQAVCFRVPSFLWKCFSLSSGIRIHDIVQQAMQPTNMEDEVRHRTIGTLARHIGRALKFQRNLISRSIFARRLQRVCSFNYSSCFISLAYILVKLMYLGNVIAQLYLMNRFLETDKYQWYGLDVIRDVVRGIPWSSSGYFPRVSLCDFTVRQVANIQKYTVQCVLIINIFNEKIFILLWFWYTLLTVATALSILYWIFLMSIPALGRAYVSHHLELNEDEFFVTKDHERRVYKFVDEYLRRDGVFLLRMVGMHAGVLISSELIMRLYKISTNIEDIIEKMRKNVTNGAPKCSDVENRLENHRNDSSENRARNRRMKKLAERLRRAAVESTDANDETATMILPLAAAAGNAESSSDSSNSSSRSKRKRGGKHSDNDDD